MRSHLFTLLSGLLLSLAASTSSLVHAAERPNFVVILCDDLGYGDLGCFGHPLIRTPHLDRLASQGGRLTDCYAAAPVCSPSRVGMLTGRTPNRAGIYDWIPANSPMHLRASETTIAELLKEGGYATALVGKFHCNGMFNQPEQPQPDHHGFDHWFATQNNALPTHENPKNFVRNGKPLGPQTGFSSNLIVNEAIRWLRERPQDKPFCLFVWLHSPHEVVATAEPYVEMYLDQAETRKQAEYFGNVTQLDHEIGRLLQHLDSEKLSEKSLVFFTSDNGPETLNRYGPNSSRSYGVPGDLRGMKLHMYEGGIRVPGIVRWPGQIEAGTVVREPVSSVDVLPTFCELAGVPLPEDRKLDGTSLVPLIQGHTLKRSVPLYWQYDNAISQPKIALRSGDWKLLATRDFESVELYNLRKDPSEKQNLSEEQPRLLQELVLQAKEIFQSVQQDGPDWPNWNEQRNRPE